MRAYRDGCSHAERPAGERSNVLANTAACWRAPSYDCQHSRLHAFTSACVHTATAARMLSGPLANTAACWRAPSYDCQQSRLHAFTSACVHTATAARMLSGETAFIDGNFRKEARVRFLLDESVTKRGVGVLSAKGR